MIARLTLLMLLLLLCAPFAYWPVRLWWARSENLEEYASKKDRYDAVALKISGMDLKLGQHRYRIAPDLNPASLQDAGSTEESGFEFIRVFREPDGTLRVQFPTQDFGHLGCCWLYYIQPSQGATDSQRFFRPGEKVQSVGTGWYAVYNPD